MHRDHYYPDVVTTTEDDSERQEERRAAWELNADDRRVLLITFAGGLAANVAVVLIVGLGLAMAHVIHREPRQFVIIAVGMVSQFLMTALIAVWDWLRWRGGRWQRILSFPSEQDYIRERLGEDAETDERRLRAEYARRQRHNQQLVRSRRFNQRVILAIMVSLSAILIVALVGVAAGLK
jgi:hypothetical protein